MELTAFQEQVFFSVVRITTTDQTNNGSSIGTGFLMNILLSKEPEKRIIALISNRHVLADPSHSISLSFHKATDDDTAPELGEIVSMSGLNYQHADYFPHPDPTVDLAGILVTTIADRTHRAYFRTLDPAHLSSFTESDLLPGKDVWFVGYPDGRFDPKHNLPLMRRGYIASIPKTDFNGQSLFVIDAQVFQGSSGSPVFAQLGGKFSFLGVVAQTMVRNQTLQIVPTNTSSVGVQQILGLGLVIKAPRVKELMDHMEAEFYRKYPSR